MLFFTQDFKTAYLKYKGKKYHFVCWEAKGKSVCLYVSMTAYGNTTTAVNNCVRTPDTDKNHCDTLMR